MNMTLHEVYRKASSARRRKAAPLPAAAFDGVRPWSDTAMEIAEALDAAVRDGADADQPEGARYITMSDTLARQFSEQLRALSLTTIRFTHDRLVYRYRWELSPLPPGSTPSWRRGVWA